MKPTLSCADWSVILERLAGATQHVAEIADLLDTCDQTEAACDEAKRIEMDLCILESRLRHARLRAGLSRSGYGCAESAA